MSSLHATQPRCSRAASAGSLLDTRSRGLYFDLILHSLSEAARQALQKMDPAKYEYQSEFARRYFGEGRLEGREEGRKEGREEGREQARVDMVLKLLTLRFGTLPESLRAQVGRSSSMELDQIAERLLTARSLIEALRPAP